MQGSTGSHHPFLKSEFNGNQITRTPELQFRLTPEYKSDNFQAAITWAYIGERCSEYRNQFALPAYQTWDFSSEFTMNEQLSLQLEIKNLTNTLGLTEGNPRDDLSTGIYFYGRRPIFGRNIEIAYYRFSKPIRANLVVTSSKLVTIVTEQTLLWRNLDR